MTLKRTLALLILLSGIACAPTTPAPPPASETHPITTGTPLTEMPPPDESRSCAFVWARRELPELSARLEQALQGIEALRFTARAVAYGEDCLDAEGDLVYFAAMQTDFYIMLEIENLADEAHLGSLLERVLTALNQFPIEQTPGPNPGYVSITFQAAGEARNLRFTVTQAEDALRQGLRGADLLHALQPPP